MAYLYKEFLKFFLFWSSFAACSNMAGFNLDEFVSGVIIKSAKISAKIFIKAVLSKPRIALICLAIYFHKELLSLTKDMLLYGIGQYPRASLILVLAGLLYTFQMEQAVSAECSMCQNSLI